jgi:hypothetical protein
MEGRFPLGAISEMTGPQSSGRTSLVLAFLAQRTHENQVVAWVDAEDAFDPESAAANGVSLRQLLWVRCRNALGPAKGKPWARLDQAIQATGQPGLHYRQCGGGRSPYLLRLQPARLVHHCRCRCWKRCLPCCHSFNQIHVETLLSAMGASGLSFLLAKFTWQIGPILRACVRVSCTEAEGWRDNLGSCPSSRACALAWLRAGPVHSLRHSSRLTVGGFHFKAVAMAAALIPNSNCAWT